NFFTHLYFGDDILVFIRRKEDSMLVLKTILEDFSSATGLKLNLNKSTILIGRLTRIGREHTFGFSNGYGYAIGPKMEKNKSISQAEKIFNIQKKEV
ncbi:hypothetical protein IFM89_000391, partial [Coptis chinensis]